MIKKDEVGEGEEDEDEDVQIVNSIPFLFLICWDWRINGKHSNRLFI